ncbi:MAG: hypothetical protein P3T54_03420 [Dehalogenimonas sp.]|uniref:Uncharacterized protein n=1 Tax=Candidatus Dehalogenimonas loeffleri TaxID=3127115 RepID=A0ABZ2J366_9CHLR|nr:hypothetical protein [Dehalogenimonas sp.]
MEPNSQTGEAGRPPRRRGAPRGNQNACKHGVYSLKTTRKIHALLERSGNFTVLQREMYAAFIRSQMVAIHDPHNDAVLNKTLKALVKLVCRHFRLDRKDGEGIMSAIQLVGRMLAALDVKELAVDAREPRREEGVFNDITDVASAFRTAESETFIEPVFVCRSTGAQS